MNKKNLLIVGATSGIMISCLEKLLNDGYNIFATYHDKQNLQNIPDKIKKSKFIQFLKLDLSSDDNSIIKILKENQVKADVIINAVGGSFGVKGYPNEIDLWLKMLKMNILKHILINNFFLEEMKKINMVEFYFFQHQQSKIRTHQLPILHQKPF